MENTSILYKIKTLEKMIARNFIKNIEQVKNNMKETPTPTQMQIIGYMIKHINEKIYQKDLEDILNLRRATVSGVLQTMEKNKLIERVTDPEDTRTKEIILNEKAKKIFEGNKKKLDDIKRVLIKDISKKELDTFSNILDKMINNLDNQNNI